MTQAVILAGGRGTRLAEVSGGLPKPLVPVGGVPVIERQIALLARYGVNEVFLTTRHLAERLEAYLGDGSRLGVQLEHVRETEPLGTAGGVAALRDRLRESFLVVYGDVLVNMDLQRLLAFHAARGAVATLVVHPNDHPYDSDLVAFEEDGRVTGFHPTPRAADTPDLANQVSAAFYALSTLALDYIEPGCEQDFVRDVFPRMLAAGMPVYAYGTTEYLKDMGTPERLRQVEADVASGRVEAMHRDHARPAAFLDRDGTINREVDGVHRPADLELLPDAAAAISRLNRAGWLVGVITNQPAIAKGFMTHSDLARVHRRLERILGDAGAWVDAIVSCPHHPERGHAGEVADLKRDCACRKPGVGMLEALAGSLPVDRSASVVVGDSWRDMAAAHAWGIDAIGVWTGHGMCAVPPLDQTAPGRPDVLVENVGQAVSVLLDPDPGVEKLAAEVISALRGGAPRPLPIQVGGLARVGKSLFVFRLRRLLRARRLEVAWLRLDDWLVPADERPPDSKVAERFRLAEAREAALSLLAGETAEAPGYDPLTRGALGSRIPMDAARADVMVVEGVPALLPQLSLPHGLRVHLEADSEDVRRARVERFYRWKGFDGQAASQLLDSRDEEHRMIESVSRSADFRLTVPALVDPGPVEVKP